MAINIEDEIKIKRLDISYIFKQIEANYKKLIEQNDFSGYDLLMFRQAYDQWERQLETPSKKLRRLTKDMKEYSKNVDLLLKKLENNKDIGKEQQKLNKLQSSITKIDFDKMGYDINKLKEIVYSQEQVSVKFKVHFTLAGYKFTNVVAKFFIKALVFTTTFSISITLGSVIEKRLTPEGDLVAKLLPALLFYLLLDQLLLRKFENKLSWFQIGLLHNKYMTIKMTIEEKIAILDRLKEEFEL